MESPHASITIAIGQYLLLVWSATVVGALTLAVLAALWARYFPRRAAHADPVAGKPAERRSAVSPVRH